MAFFEIGNIAVEILGYQVSYVELIATLSGLVSVYFASRANILTWATGIVNEVFLFILFFQVQLYADMFLQVYFFMVTLYGWYYWKTNVAEKVISEIRLRSKVLLVAAIFIFSWIAGFLFSRIHLFFPAYFKTPAAYPYIDSFVMVLSIAATVLLAKKKVESWYLWIAVDVICVGLYFKREIFFLSLEYFIFLGLASYGFFNWRKQMRHG